MLFVRVLSMMSQEETHLRELRNGKIDKNLYCRVTELYENANPNIIVALVGNKIDKGDFQV